MYRFGVRGTDRPDRFIRRHSHTPGTVTPTTTPRLLAIVLPLALVAMGPADNLPAQTGTTKKKKSAPAKPPPADLRFCIVPVPRIENPDVHQTIDGSRRTLLAPATLGKFGLRIYNKEEFEKLGMKWADFHRRAQVTATARLYGLKPRYIRNAKKVIEYAILQSDDPLTAGFLISPAFRHLFRNTIGDDLLLAIPDRNTVYVFPTLVTDYAKLGPEIVTRYRDAVYPVTTELLRLDAKGLRAIGDFLRE